MHTKKTGFKEQGRVTYFEYPEVVCVNSHGTQPATKTECKINKGRTMRCSMP